MIMKINHLLYFLSLYFCTVCLIGCGRSVPLTEQFKNFAAGPNISLAHEVCSEYAESKVIKKQASLSDIDEYKIGSSCRYLFNTTHLRIIQKLDAYEGIGVLCGPFGCNPKSYQIILPHPITSSIINIIEPENKYCVEISEYDEVIILSLNRKYSLRERKNMLRKKQRELNQKYLETLVHEYNTCYKTRTDW